MSTNAQAPGSSASKATASTADTSEAAATADAPIPSNTRNLGVDTESHFRDPGVWVGEKGPVVKEEVAAEEKPTVTKEVKAAEKATPEVKATEKATPEVKAEATTGEKKEGEAEGVVAEKKEGDGSPLTPADVKAYEAEFLKEGKLTEASYESLAKLGFDKGIVDDFIAMRQAKADSLSAEWTEMMGGDEQKEAIVTWARDNYDAKKKDAVNAIMDTGNEEQIKLAIQGMVSDYKGAGQAFEPSRQTGEGSEARPTVTGFASEAEYRAEVRSERYKKDPAHRAQVQAKLRASPKDIRGF